MKPGPRMHYQVESDSNGVIESRAPTLAAARRCGRAWKRHHPHDRVHIRRCSSQCSALYELVETT